MAFVLGCQSKVCLGCVLGNNIALLVFRILNERVDSVLIYFECFTSFFFCCLILCVGVLHAIRQGTK